MINTLININTNIKFIHYGKFDYFNHNFFNEIKNTHNFKPFGGLWASPKKTEYGWLDFCNDAGYGNYDKKSIQSFEFLLSKNAKVIIIDNENDIINCIEKYGYSISIMDDFSLYLIDYEKLSQDFDALFLTLSGLNASKNMDDIHKGMLFSLYDCESIIIFNKNIIVSL